MRELPKSVLYLRLKKRKILKNIVRTIVKSQSILQCQKTQTDKHKTRKPHFSMETKKNDFFWSKIWVFVSSEKDLIVPKNSKGDQLKWQNGFLKSKTL